MLFHYKLIGKLAVPCKSIEEWIESFGSSDRRVGWTQVCCLTVSTVFLGLDHGFDPEGEPMLFETMIFDDGEDDFQVRCSTWEQAEAQHAKAVAEATRRCEAAEAVARSYQDSEKETRDE